MNFHAFCSWKGLRHNFHQWFVLRLQRNHINMKSINFSWIQIKDNILFFLNIDILKYSEKKVHLLKLHERESILYFLLLMERSGLSLFTQTREQKIIKSIWWYFQFMTISYIQSSLISYSFIFCIVCKRESLSLPQNMHTFFVIPIKYYFPFLMIFQ